MRTRSPGVAASTSLLILLLVGCIAAEPPTHPATSTVVTELEEGDHTAGTYSYSRFEPRIEVAVPDDSWTTYHLFPDFFDVATNTDDGPIDLMFLRPIAFLTPEQEDVQADTPAEAIHLLSAHEGAMLSEPRDVEISGLSGLEVDASFANDNTHVIRVSAGNIGFGPSADVRLAVVEADEGLLLIGLSAPAGQMDEAKERTQSVRDSIVIH